ncbi:MAG: tRNA (adenosine(37)-N6)-dimethylallyltransferase MiaA [Desulfovibrionales bacterium]|jgi:tRNA dimethylallyltransferase|nr:tRNA (adenosine(37)-N6)-dimethylallyltransferase MiaA [Desulfovibrionales bacterium]
MSQALALIALVGATGTGKTAVALALAKALGGGVVNFDSRQVYQGLDIVTAQPTLAEQSQCPHALYGYLPVDQSIRAGAFSEEILAMAQKFNAQGVVPILVGGTGLYLKSLVDGLAPIPDIDASIRKEIMHECQTLGSPVLHARLSIIDPQYAARIHPNDPQRICRALEVYTATGQTLSWWHSQAAPAAHVRVLQIGLDTELKALTPRLAQRITAMLELGALHEVERAYDQYPQRTAPGFSGIGCPELLAVLLDGLDMDEAQRLWLRNTRAYAKRQLTWFRKDQRVFWHAPEDEAGIVARALSFVSSSL